MQVSIGRNGFVHTFYRRSSLCSPCLLCIAPLELQCNSCSIAPLFRKSKACLMMPLVRLCLWCLVRLLHTCPWKSILCEPRFDYMMTYADILYAYGAYVHGSQYSRRSQIRLIARLQSRNGTRYCSSGSQWKKKQIQHSSQQKQHNRKSTLHIICI